MIFIIDEVKNFTANNIIQVDGISHVLGSVQRLVTDWRFVQQGKEDYYMIKFNWLLK